MLSELSLNMEPNKRTLFTSQHISVFVVFCLVMTLLVPVANAAQSYAFAQTTSETTPVQSIDDAPTRTKGPSAEMLAAMNKSDDATMSSDGLSTPERISKYVKSGFVHILPLGLDHILFVLALFLSTTAFSKLFWQITAFTLAHSVTLALSSLGIISLSGDIVEPLIALSIVWMAIDNIRYEEAKKHRLYVIVLFGLLHGMGFASVLGEFGLPQDAFLTALFSFNIGVEIGQLAVLLMATVLFYFWSKKPSYRMFVQLPLSAIIGVVGSYWFIERVFGL